MKYFTFYIATLLMLHFPGNTLAQSENLSPPDSAQAEVVMNQYFTALAGGDIATLKVLLGGKLKAKRVLLLNNPEYTNYLVTTYANASFQILDIYSNSPNTVLIDVLISFGLEESIRKAYTLKHSTSSNTVMPYQIIGEVTAANLGSP
ncbi:hypothetical protein MNBD_GAMMA16-1402 [hydrothermal vent metagenome]|uniref:Uncharacterized protein n=1 Tax=hydrothermal vent metagenome TaxID=652676 RepID=A0A3B0Z3W1_9ZZZZ